MINGLKPRPPCAGAWSAAAALARIGYIHRSAALRDNTFTLLARRAILMPSADASSAQQLGWIDRCYADYQSLFRSRLPGLTAFRRCQLPRQIAPLCHLPGRADRKLHVVCEKPLCFSGEES